MRRAVLPLLAALLGFTGTADAQAPADDGRLQIRGEYLLWWTRDSPTPVPLITSGALGAPGTQVFLGGGDAEFDERHGVRITVGYWVTPDRTWGLEASGFFLPTSIQRRTVSGSGAPGTPNLLIPFFDPTIPRENTTFLSLAGSFSGTATESLRSRLWGLELNRVGALAGRGDWRLELLGGVRYLKLREEYTFETSSPDLGPGAVNVFTTRDAFDADNDFYGAQVGVRARYQRGRFMADAGAKLAVGVMRQTVDIAGSLTTNQFTGSTAVTFIGGYFAQPTNIGSYTRIVVAVVPEATLNLGYQLTDWASIVVGYTLLYANNVVRPGQQIDHIVNPTQSPSFGGPATTSLAGAARPRFRFESSDFWAQGLNVGIVLRY